ncbi:hypothetical protein HPB48_023133 [Haemaphysalis longicornis]|uniref:Ionotropic receptor n=1 Tax=Haemaphysalis longicornis TaxID=44386 RepID=A0A9J6GZ63_HAELO|nr:hypothetical protein HPB48_023133 [Haemaphysalis longicornis]
MCKTDDIIFLSCGKEVYIGDTFVMRNLKHKTTVWSLQGAASLYKFLLGNIAHNRRTITVIPKLSKKERGCLTFVKHATRPLFLVDVVILNNADNILFAQQASGIFRGRRLVCIERFRDSGQKAQRQSPVASYETVRLSARCLSLNHDCPNKKKQRISGSEVLFGCLHRSGETSSMCENIQFRLIFEGLQARNATLRLSIYASEALLLRDLYRGGIDIILPTTVINKLTLANYRFPGIVEYRHDTFYARKGKHLTSLTKVLVQSGKIALFTLLSLVASWITLSLSHCMHARMTLNIAAILDFGGFLIASLLSTSAPIPRGQANASRSHSFLLTAWMIAIFPLSFYFRGELTSRLSIRIPPNPIDSLEELDAALDNGQLTPCFVAGSAFYVYFQRDDRRSDASLYVKIRAASKKHSNEPACLVSSPSECIRSRALKDTHACFMHSVNDCGPHKLGPYVVKSREPLQLALVSTAARKDFAMREAYGNLLSTIFEGALNPQGFNNHWNCRRDISSLDILPDQGETEQFVTLLQLSVFFTCFVGLHLLSIAVFCGELAFSWWQRSCV